MSKTIKILGISLICIFIFAETCFAVNIDMNLGSNLVDGNTTANFENSNSLNSNSESTSNAVSNTTSNTSTATSSTRSSSLADTLQSLPESELGLTNILNILLIAIGIVLILLSIAIFIRLGRQK